MENDDLKNSKEKEYPTIASANILEESEMTRVLGGDCKQGCVPGGKISTGDQEPN